MSVRTLPVSGNIMVHEVHPSAFVAMDPGALTPSACYWFSNTNRPRRLYFMRSIELESGKSVYAFRTWHGSDVQLTEEEITNLIPLKS